MTVRILDYKFYSLQSSGNGFNVEHGLSKAPEVIIMKNRDYANNWDVYHHKNGSNPSNIV